MLTIIVRNYIKLRIYTDLLNYGSIFILPNGMLSSVMVYLDTTQVKNNSFVKVVNLKKYYIFLFLYKSVLDERY